MPARKPRNPDGETLFLAGHVLSNPDMPADLKSKAGRALVNRRWSRTPRARRREQTRAATDAMWQKYLDAVPPEVTDPEERAALARQARRARMQELTVARLARKAGK